MGLFRSKTAKPNLIFLLWREWAGNHRKTFQYSVSISLPTYKALQNQLLLPKVHQQQHQAGGFGKPQQTKCYPAFIGLFLSHILYRSGGLHFIGRDSGILEKIGKDWKGFLAFDLAVAPGKWCNFVPKNSSLWKVLLNQLLLLKLSLQRHQAWILFRNVTNMDADRWIWWKG